MDEYLGADGWLIPGRHEVDMADIEAAFVPAGDPRRTAIWKSLEILLSACKEHFEGGVLLIAGSFVSRSPSPVSMPTVAVVPEDPADVATWTDAQAERFTAFLSLHDVIVGSLDPTYVPVLHPLSGAVEVLYCEPNDAPQLELWMGTVTMSDGRDIVGARGVLEVAW